MSLVKAELKTREGQRWMLDGAFEPSKPAHSIFNLQKSPKHLHVVTGFPRSLEQAELAEDAFRVDFAINIDVPFDVIAHRLSVRLSLLTSPDNVA